MATKSILGNKSTVLFILLAAFFVANTIVAEFIGSKIFSLEKFLPEHKTTYSKLPVPLMQW